MKKILLKLLPAITLIAALFLYHPAFAASFSTSLSGDDTFDTSTTLTVIVNNITGFEGACGGFCGLSGILTYDSSKIKITASSAGGFDVILGSNLVAYKTTGSNTSSNIATLTITNIALADGESTVISLSEVIGSNGDDDIPGTGSTKTLTRRIPQQTQIQEPSSTPQPEQSEDTANTTSDSNTSSNTNSASGQQSSTSDEKDQTTTKDETENLKNEDNSSTPTVTTTRPTTTTQNYNSTTSVNNEQPSQDNLWIWFIIVPLIIAVVVIVTIILVLMQKRKKLINF